MHDSNDTRRLDAGDALPLETRLLDNPSVGNGLSLYKSPIPSRLRVVFPDDSERVYSALYPQLVIGRRTKTNYRQIDIDLSPYDDEIQGVSRIHAVIIPEREGLMLKDMRSVNGTQLNEKLLTPAETYLLATGDKIKVGNLRLRVYFEFED
jgi:pSer/pThr/pTyr-binding forkhead associated (FHA) protein